MADIPTKQLVDSGGRAFYPVIKDLNIYGQVCSLSIKKNSNKYELYLNKELLDSSNSFTNNVIHFDTGNINICDYPIILLESHACFNSTWEFIIAGNFINNIIISEKGFILNNEEHEGDVMGNYGAKALYWNCKYIQKIESFTNTFNVSVDKSVKL